MNISIVNKQSDLKINSKQVKSLVERVVAFEGRHCDEAAIFFIDSDEITELHGRFFGDPTPTDCISFPIDLNSFLHQSSDEDGAGAYCVLGDVFVCPQVAINYAQRRQKDPYDEMTLYIVHGLLHLMGYDDIEKSDRQEMRLAEKRHMRNLRQNNLMLKE